MPKPATSLSKPSRGGGLSSLKTIQKPSGLSQLDTIHDAGQTGLQPGRTTARPLPQPSTAGGASSGGVAPKAGPIPGLSNTDLGGPVAKYYDPPGKTGGPGAGKTMPATAKPTQARPQAAQTNKPSGGPGKTTLQSPSRSPQSTMMDSGVPSQSHLRMPTDGAQPSVMAPWDRPPLGSVPLNQWGADEHFMSNL